jgi:predicted ATP-grasp superfamily ATP-dependent carboligase
MFTVRTAHEMRNVLVLDANQRSALAIIRSLGRRGLSIVAGDPAANPLGSASRYAAASVRYPDPASAPGQFISQVTDIVDRLAIDTVIPATDLTTMLLVSQSNLPKNVHVAAPSANSYESLTDKARLVELAGQLGIAVPQTRIARTADAVVDAAHVFGFPVVLKPARSRYLKDNQVRATGVQIVHRAAALPSTVRSLSWLGDLPCLVQRFVPGYGAGVFALYGPSGPTAWFAHRRLREKPPTGGVSVLSESVPLDPALQSAAAQLLTAVGWTGVAMVEFRVAADGTAYLMEVNGRFWGSLQLAIDSGIDFPWLLYQMTQGKPVDSPAPYRVGRRLRWFLGDLDSLLLELRADSGGIEHKTRALAAFARSGLDLRCRQEIFRLSDPGPGFREAIQWIRALRICAH